MKPDTLAPWAGIVPDAPFPQTATDPLARMDGGWMYALVQGRPVRMPGSGYEASRMPVRLAAALLLEVTARRYLAAGVRLIESIWPKYAPGGCLAAGQ